jgi:diaminopimelate decarboxylase
MFDQLHSIFPATAEAPDGVLRIGGVDVRSLADEHGTPVIAYDRAHVEAAARAWIDAVRALPAGATIAYATKAFTSIELLRRLGELGLGADVSSLGELEVARRAGIDPALIVLHGNNKSRDELEAAVRLGVGLVVVDAEGELDLLASIAREHDHVQGVLVRVNPDIEVETHRYISTSHAGSKFGVPGKVAASMLAQADADAHIDVRGVHVHLGSQLLDAEPWQRVLTWMAGWARDLHDRHGIAIRTLDVGGGLGIAYLEDQRPPTPAQVVDAVGTTLAGAWATAGLQMPHVVFEPGRSIVGQAAITIYSVGVVKQTGDDQIRYVNVDGGMSDNPRPSLYQARYRALLGERVHDAATGTWWVAGVHCESGDVLIEDAPLPEPIPGELLVIPATGAYAASMASTYNMVPRCAVVSVADGSSRLLLRRESIDDLLARDADDVGSTAQVT